MPRTTPQEGEDLAHIVVCGGTPEEWARMSRGDWQTRFAVVSAGVRQARVHWATLVPHHGALSVDQRVHMHTTWAEMGSTERTGTDGERYVYRPSDGVSIVVDPRPDGHARFASVAEALRSSGAGITEPALSEAVLAPAVGEPDLALILGPPDVVPASLVWELAYSELVFLDIAWSDLQATHLEMAIDDFSRRHRRFGGLDS